MKLTPKIFLLLGFCMILNSSCNLDGIVNRVMESNENMDALLITKEAYPITSFKALNVSTSGGSISVTGDADQEAILEMYVKPNNGRNLSREEIQDILDRDYDIDIEQRNGTLHAHAKRRGTLNWDNPLSISFKVHTGNQLRTDLSTSGGSIQLANLLGDQTFSTSGGSLQIDNVEGDIDGQTSGGGIHAYNAQGTINLTTSGGSIELENLDGQVFVSTSGGSIKGQRIMGALTAETSGGSIDLDDLTCTLKASTSGGGVTAGITKLVGDVQLATSAGSINLTIPRDAAADLNLEGSKVNTSDLLNFNGSNAKGKLRGSINGGGTSIEAATSAGSVNLNYR